MMLRANRCLRLKYWQVPCPRWGLPYLDDCGYELVIGYFVKFFGRKWYIMERKLCDVPNWEVTNQATIGDRSPTISRWARRLRNAGIIE